MNQQPRHVSRQKTPYLKSTALLCLAMLLCGLSLSLGNTTATEPSNAGFMAQWEHQVAATHPESIRFKQSEDDGRDFPPSLVDGVAMQFSGKPLRSFTSAAGTASPPLSPRFILPPSRAPPQA